MIKKIINKTKNMFGKKADTTDMPALFHITNYKAGSQWIYGILRDLFPEDKVVKPLPKVRHVLAADKLKEGFVYPTTYVNADTFNNLRLPENYKNLVIFRDLRDVLVSLYFSVAKSHPAEFPAIKESREALNSMEFEEGMLHLLNTRMSVNAKIQASWRGVGSFIKYEDLLTNDYEILKNELIVNLNLPIDESRLKFAVESNRFSKLAKGRKHGEEDQGSHYRKGIQGDWVNYFTPKIKEQFKELYGDHLILMGYELDLNW
ncbi:sulfotransferase domain-containing protein [Campylobacterota bacterium]